MIKILTYIISCFFLLCLQSCTCVIPEKTIEGFQQLDNSLRWNNNILFYENNNDFNDLQEKAETLIHLKPVVNTVRESLLAVDDFYRFIDDLKLNIINATGGAYSKEEAIEMGKPHLEGISKGGANTVIPHNILIEGFQDGENIRPQGELIDEKIQKLKKYYLDLLAGLWDNEGIKNTSFKDSTSRDSLISKLKEILTLSWAESYDKNLNDGISWSGHTFGNLPVAAVFALFSKFQNDLLNSEAAFIGFINEQIEQQEPTLNYMILNNPHKSLIKRGEIYQTEISLVRYFISENSDLIISVNGENLDLVDGKFQYKVRPTSTGKKVYTAKASIRNPLTGKFESYKTDFEYEVFE
jgi:hypothetical protein